MSYINIGSKKSPDFSHKESARISCSTREQGTFIYVWMPEDFNWEYVVPKIKDDFSEIVLECHKKNVPTAVKVRAPHGNHKYPGIHIRPHVFGVKPFKLTEIPSLVIKNNTATIKLPSSVRKNFSKAA